MHIALMSSIIVELRDNVNRSLQNELKVDEPKNALTRASYKYNMWAVSDGKDASDERRTFSVDPKK